MCDSGENPKRRYFLGPYEDPDHPCLLMTVEHAVDDLRERFASGELGDQII